MDAAISFEDAKASGSEDSLETIESLLACSDALDSPVRVNTQASAAKLMVVDDEPTNVKVIRRYLELGGYTQFVATSDPTRALDLFGKHHPDIVIVDLVMPHVGGLEILRRIREDPDHGLTPVLVLTATEKQEDKLAALEAGATDFLCKPVDPTELVPRVRNSLAVKAYQDHLRIQADELEQQVRKRTAELETSRLEVICCLARAAEFRDNETGRHVMRVGRYVAEIAGELGIPEEQVKLLELAAPLHDMGKIGIPDSLLLKPGRLDEEEFARMKKHAEFGHSIVSTSENDAMDSLSRHTSAGAEFMKVSRSPLLTLAASIALTHHEKWDGSGYPKGLKREEIPIEGRITAVADVFDALSTRRPYKAAFPIEKCLGIIREGSGQHFEPRIVEAFFAVLPRILAIRKELADDDPE